MPGAALGTFVVVAALVPVEQVWIWVLSVTGHRTVAVLGSQTPNRLQQRQLCCVRSVMR